MNNGKKFRVYPLLLHPQDGASWPIHKQLLHTGLFSNEIYSCYLGRSHFYKKTADARTCVDYVAKTKAKCFSGSYACAPLESSVWWVLNQGRNNQVAHVFAMTQGRTTRPVHNAPSRNH